MIAAIKDIILSVLAFFAGYAKGASDKVKERLEAENEILKKQRDDNIYNIDSANRFWVRKRKDK